MYHDYHFNLFQFQNVNIMVFPFNELIIIGISDFDHNIKFIFHNRYVIHTNDPILIQNQH